MATDYNSSDTTDGADATAAQYNALREDIIETNKKALASLAGEAISATSTAIPVYILPADSEVYIASDNSDFQKMAVVGFVENQNVSGAGNVEITHQGRINNLSGLTPGYDYFLAKAGTGESTYTDGDNTTGSSADVGDSTNDAWARAWTPTNIAGVTNFKVRIAKSGTPVGTVYCSIVESLQNQDPNHVLQQVRVIRTASVLVSSFSSGDLVDFDFGVPVRIGAGNAVYFMIWHSESDASNKLQIQNDSLATDCWVRSGGGSWISNSIDAQVEVTCVGGTFSAGDITEYYYDYGKRVGRAITATELLLDLAPRQGLLVGKSSGTLYQAEVDGTVIATATGTGSTVPQFTLYVNGQIAAHAGDASNSADARSTISYPVKKGDGYIVYDDGTAAPAVSFIPLL